MSAAAKVHERATLRLHIGEFAKRSLLSRDTVRFYEKAGLLTPHVEPNGYRVFDEHHLEFVRSIRIAQLLGFTLAEIKAQMGQWETLTLRARIRFMEEKIEVLDARMAELREMRAYLDEKARWMRAGKSGVPQSLEDAALQKRKRVR